MSDFNENLNGEQSDKTSSSSAEPVVNDQPSFVEAQIVTGVEPAKKKSVLPIIAVILVILIAGGILAYNIIPTVKNNVKMLISKPENYYSWVEEQNLKNTADKISKGYGKAINTSNAMEQELKADINPENVSALIEQLSGTSLAESGVTLPSNISIKVGENNDKAAVKAAAGDKNLATVNMYLKDGIYYFQIPELSSSYVSMDIKAYMDEMLNDLPSENLAFMKGYFDTLTSMSTDPNAIKELLSEDELNEFIVKYFNIIFENMDDVELSKGVSCEANGVKTKYNKLSVNVDQGTLFSILKDILNEAKSDNTIIKLIEKFGLQKDTYASAIDGLLDQMGSLDVRGGDTVLTMNVYVDSKGAICGRDIEIPDQPNNTIGYMTTKDGSDNAIKVDFMIDGEGIQVAGKYEEKSGKESGNLTLTAVGANDAGGDIVIPISYKDFETVNEDKGYCKGEFTIDLSQSNLPVLTLALDSDGKGQTIKSDINVDGTNYGTISLISKEETTIEIPEFDASQKVYQFTEDGSQLQPYITEISGNLTAFFDNVGSAFGVQGMGALMNGLMTATDDIDDFDDLGLNNDDFEFNDADLNDASLDENDAEYDFKKMVLQMNGQNVTIPAKINGILNFVTVEDEQVEPGDFVTYSNDDFNFSVTLDNNTSAAAAPADCTVSGITVSEGSPVAFSVDGFTLGSSLADVAAKYGVKLDDPQDGEINIYDTASPWNYVTFYASEGKVNMINFNIIDM